MDLGVLLTFIRLAIEEEFNNSVKYQYAESAKLYSLVSVLIRSCDVTKYMNSAIKVIDFYENYQKFELVMLTVDHSKNIFRGNHVNLIPT